VRLSAAARDAFFCAGGLPVVNELLHFSMRFRPISLMARKSSTLLKGRELLKVSRRGRIGAYEVQACPLFAAKTP
jgi:hypothetical protein